MSHFRLQFLALTCFVLVAYGLGTPTRCLAQDPASIRRQAQLVFFEKKIRPVLVRECYSCHSVEASKKNKLRGGLLLDSKAGLLKGGESGPALVVGKPEESLLQQALK